MDEKNQRLIDLLQVNARQSTSSLARKLNLSRTAVHERINKLEKSGVIQGYTIRLDKEFVQKFITAQVMIETNPKLNKQITAELKTVPQVRALYTVNGQFDFIAMIRSETTEQMDAVLDRICDIEGIEKTLSSIILSTKFVAEA